MNGIDAKGYEGVETEKCVAKTKEHWANVAPDTMRNGTTPTIVVLGDFDLFRARSH